MKKGTIGRKRHRPAFTLIELVVVLAICGLLLVVTVPRIGALYDRQLVEQQARLLENDLVWLRSEARRSGENASFRRQGSDGYSLTVQGEDGVRSEMRTLVSPRLQLSTTSTGGQIIFQPRGTAYEKCTVTLRCGEQARTVVVNNLGRIRVGVVS